MSYPIAAYLAAKTSVDDRALNRLVLAQLRGVLPNGAPRVLEIGAGLGTMVARLLDWGVVEAGDYTLLDVDGQLLDDSLSWLREWAGRRGMPCRALPDGIALGDLSVHLVHAELADYAESGPSGSADLLIANAVLDLVDVPTVLPGLLRTVVPGGAYWFTINYDGESAFVPDHPADEIVLRAYHRDMDQRVRHGRLAGESRAGRHLFEHLRKADATVLAAGSSDWVVHAYTGGVYPQDEAFFLHCILTTIADALDCRDEVPPEVLADWLAVRRRQLAAGELVYLAHQIDVAGRVPQASRRSAS